MKMDKDFKIDQRTSEAPNSTGSDSSHVPKPRRTRANGRLIALSSAAILSVYALGYARTESAADTNFDSLATHSLLPSPTAPANTGNNVTSPPSATIRPGRQYADGTYTGLGTSRHGNIEVTLVIKNGRIDSASVSRCSTRYPCSDVNPLVREVLSTQTVPVDHVSGATDSSKAYKDAVNQALAKAV